MSRQGDNYAGNAEFWIKIIRQGLDPYRLELTDQAVLEAIGPCSGLRVLDAGCGEGYLSRYIARTAADTCGIDLCSALISAATDERDRQGLDIDYRVASLEAIPYPDETFDVVVCNHVTGDVVNLAAAVKEISRVTKRQGRAVFMLLHPCFVDQPVDVRTYFSARRMNYQFNVSGIDSPESVPVTFLPLEYYSSLLLENGFVITKLAEPHPTPEQLASDWWRANFTKPMFMLMVGERR